MLRRQEIKEIEKEKRTGYMVKTSVFLYLGIKKGRGDGGEFIKDQSKSCWERWGVQRKVKKKLGSQNP